MRRLISYKTWKRPFDVASASVGLALGAPILLAVAAGVYYNLGSPVIFEQLRPGKDGKVFILYKFRSLKDEEYPDQPDEERLTEFGRKLRAWSLDELPELWNVLKGDMSLVGPRPLLVEYLEHYSPEEARRHEVNPGITGLAQASGRNELTWAERFELDVEYVDTMSFRKDMTILCKTVARVLGRHGISHGRHATMYRLSDLRG